MSKMPSAQDLQVLLELAVPELELMFRPMFGGIMCYVHGRPFASISNIGLAFKFKGIEHKERLRQPGAKPLQYESTSPPSKSYVLVPNEILKDTNTVAEWARASASSTKSKI